MKYRIVHMTRYEYNDAATLCHNQVHLTPRDFERQRCLSCHLEVSPVPAATRTWVDVFGNTATYFTIEQSHNELGITAQSEVEVWEDIAPPRQDGLAWDQVAAQIANGGSTPGSGWADGLFDAASFACDSPRIPRLSAVRDYAQASFPPGRPLDEAVRDMTARIYEDFQYDPSATSVSTPTSEILATGRGVCQDFAHLEIACLRAFGLAARYVSGYLVTQPPPGKPRLIGADASHAWTSVFFPGQGWIDFDPTNNKTASIDYITLAWGRDYSDVCPIKGIFLGGGAHSMTVSVDVAPVE